MLLNELTVRPAQRDDLPEVVALLKDGRLLPGETARLTDWTT